MRTICQKYNKTRARGIGFAINTRKNNNFNQNLSKSSLSLDYLCQNKSLAGYDSDWHWSTPVPDFLEWFILYWFNTIHAFLLLFLSLSGFPVQPIRDKNPTMKQSNILLPVIFLVTAGRICLNFQTDSLFPNKITQKHNHDPRLVNFIHLMEDHKESATVANLQQIVDSELDALMPNLDKLIILTDRDRDLNQELENNQAQITNLAHNLKKKKTLEKKVSNLKKRCRNQNSKINKFYAKTGVYDGYNDYLRHKGVLDGIKEFLDQENRTSRDQIQNGLFQDLIKIYFRQVAKDQEIITKQISRTMDDFKKNYETVKVTPTTYFLPDFYSLPERFQEYRQPIENLPSLLDRYNSYLLQFRESFLQDRVYPNSNITIDQVHKIIADIQEKYKEFLSDPTLAMELSINSIHTAEKQIAVIQRRVYECTKTIQPDIEQLLSIRRNWLNQIDKIVPPDSMDEKLTNNGFKNAIVAKQIHLADYIASQIYSINQLHDSFYRTITTSTYVSSSLLQNLIQSLNSDEWYYLQKLNSQGKIKTMLKDQNESFSEPLTKKAKTDVSLSLQEPLSESSTKMELSFPTQESHHLANRSSVDWFNDDQPASSSLPSYAVHQIWNIFFKDVWQKYEKAIQMVTQEKKNQIRTEYGLPPITVQSATTLKDDLEISDLKEKIHIEESNRVNPELNRVHIPQLANPSALVGQIVNSTREFMTRQFLVATLYQPFFFNDVLNQCNNRRNNQFFSQVIHLKRPWTFVGPEDYQNFPEIHLVRNQKSEDQMGNTTPTFFGRRATEEFNDEVKYNVSPFMFLKKIKPGLYHVSNPYYKYLSLAPMPSIGFHHDHFFSLKPNESFNINRPVLQGNRFLRFMYQHFISEWLTHQEPLFSNLKKGDCSDLMKSCNLSYCRADQKDLPVSFELEGDNKSGSGDEQNPLNSKMKQFGETYIKYSSIPLFKLGQRHYHKATQSDVSQPVGSFYDKYIEPLLFQKHHSNVVDMLYNNWFESRVKDQPSNTDKNSLKHSLLEDITEKILPYTPFGNKSEANHFLVSKQASDGSTHYSLSRDSRVYKNIIIDLKNLELITTEIPFMNDFSEHEHNITRFPSIPLYHKLVTPYIIDGTVSELIHVLSNHRVNYLHNITQPLRASRLEFNLHINECVRYLQNQHFFEKWKELLVESANQPSSKIQRSGPSNLTHSSAESKKFSTEEKARLDNNLKTLLTVKSILLQKTLITSHTLLAIKYANSYLIQPPI